MMITDVIVEAKSGPEIYFLLTAYLESVQFGDKFGLLPEHIMRLPLNGMTDLKQRLDDLERERERDGPCCLPSDKTRLFIQEALEVMGTAVHRLACLARPESTSLVDPYRGANLEPERLTYRTQDGAR